MRRATMDEQIALGVIDQNAIHRRPGAERPERPPAIAPDIDD